ncbi:hypothetical protein EGI31_19760 [Lacihabitans soyangensis]|uniref:Uncharacterized protein n=1 Tax=Lacihabitans soyangensis TaxID=869394 RepID=A0AAE3H658_9BACT|nr:hypothetical protein [Lacihabitans soyangensis]
MGTLYTLFYYPIQLFFAALLQKYHGPWNSWKYQNNTMPKNKYITNLSSKTHLKCRNNLYL